jgi:hypothetical protein
MKKQTCLKPVYSTDKEGRTSRTHFAIKLPEIITDDIGFEMQFGWPAPKHIGKRPESGIKVQHLDKYNNDD